MARGGVLFLEGRGCCGCGCGCGDSGGVSSFSSFTSSSSFSTTVMLVVVFFSGRLTDSLRLLFFAVDAVFVTVFVHAGIVPHATQSPRELRRDCEALLPSPLTHSSSSSVRAKGSSAPAKNQLSRGPSAMGGLPHTLSRADTAAGASADRLPRLVYVTTASGSPERFIPSQTRTPKREGGKNDHEKEKGEITQGGGRMRWRR